MFDLPPPDPGIELSVASRGMSKGLAQTEGPQLVVRPSLQSGPLQVGGQWKNVGSPAADGEGVLFANLGQKAGAIQFSVAASYKFQTGVSVRTDDDALELTGSATGRLGRVGGRISLVYSPDDLGTTGRSIYLEGGLNFELGKRTRLSGNVARRERAGSKDYTAISLGISQALPLGVSADLRYYDTAQSALGEPYRARLVLSARMSF